MTFVFEIPPTHAQDRRPVFDPQQFPIQAAAYNFQIPVSPLITELCEDPVCSPPGIACPSNAVPNGTVLGGTGLGDTGGKCDWFDCDFLARGYYVNDQRLQWSGQEATFGAEGVVTPVVRRQWGAFEVTMLGELYLNQPFDRNILIDTQERRSYKSNFDVDTLEISQLLVSVRRCNLEVVAGKMVTPFGRFYFPLYSNARLDAPFLRTEAIRWRETGLLIRYDPGCFIGEMAITNGCDGLDTNSSKALIARLGLQGESFAVGCSAKQQDGIGSEMQKQFNSHVGLDFMTRCNCFTFSCEAIYDEYGFRHPEVDPDDITWGRSIYYRDQFYQLDTPITGAGYYCNLDFDRGPWAVTLNYGEFYPQGIGDARHDVTNRRGIVKVAYDITPFLKSYLVAMVETEGYTAQAGRARKGQVALTGLQYVF